MQITSFIVAALAGTAVAQFTRDGNISKDKISRAGRPTGHPVGTGMSGFPSAPTSMGGARPFPTGNSEVAAEAKSRSKGRGRASGQRSGAAKPSNGARPAKSGRSKTGDASSPTSTPQFGNKAKLEGNSAFSKPTSFPTGIPRGAAPSGGPPAFGTGRPNGFDVKHSAVTIPLPDLTTLPSGTFPTNFTAPSGFDSGSFSAYRGGSDHQKPSGVPSDLPTTLATSTRSAL
ncbi:hypothetical protein GLAREA_11602 [Glarea lozoyensis ATCC 20868]|uniref:Uncharacterized protein n=2 Tax=Glarea lozoyensis TaxID=101852 RepID=S3CYW0_GLAL2|nr:uncharacterized protein GLAREA_11602 [Glarea lozoyensis ATCC 20868]EHL01306.1 hypothetical protein M7I_2637 [Glarea lozoyensis 74030]EPE25021.1 hypothetical protein GLAREA_11602 [Glarea lozoyensis ATCC 20868]